MNYNCPSLLQVYDNSEGVNPQYHKNNLFPYGILIKKSVLN